MPQQQISVIDEHTLEFIAPPATASIAAGRKFGAVVRGLPGASGVAPQLVVERAMYTSAAGETWSGGTNAMGTRIR